MAHLEASRDILMTKADDHYLVSKGKIPIKDYMNTQYTVSVSFGTPPQSFMMVPDTGSSNVWVYKSGCATTACYLHKQFNNGKSSSFKDDEEHPFILHYGSGGIKGNQAYDNIKLGTSEADNFHFGLVEEADGIAFIASSMCGIIGLGWPEISAYGMPVYADKALEEKNRNYAFYLHTNPEKSYITFPGIDTSVSSIEDFTFHPVIEDKYWSLDLQSFGGYDLSGTKGVIDSGTSLIVGAKDQIDAILNGATVATDCSDMDQLKDLEVVFNNESYTLTPEQYVIKVTQGKETQCVMGLMAAAFPAGFDYMIIGDVFMRAYPTYFDKDNNRVGFLKNAQL